MAFRSCSHAYRRRSSLTGITFVMIVMGWAAALCQSKMLPLAPTASADEIVQKMVEHNRDRENRLKYYASRRRYHLEYHGFPASADATMEAEMDYDAPSKTFRVLSESGSHALINHALRKLLKSEQDAAENQRENTLTPSNYDFSFLETTIDNGRRLFILRVEPKVARKFLYRGKIWVDAEDYAVVRIEAVPAQSPSFWIRDTRIQHLYAKNGDFWLPKQNTSMTKVRMGGTATLTIDYESYRFQRSGDQALKSPDKTSP